MELRKSLYTPITKCIHFRGVHVFKTFLGVTLEAANWHACASPEQRYAFRCLFVICELYSTVVFILILKGLKKVTGSWIQAAESFIWSSRTLRKQFAKVDTFWWCERPAVKGYPAGSKHENKLSCSSSPHSFPETGGWRAWKDRGRNKSHKYWPRRGPALKCGKFHLINLNERTEDLQDGRYKINTF